MALTIQYGNSNTLHLDAEGGSKYFAPQITGQIITSLSFQLSKDAPDFLQVDPFIGVISQNPDSITSIEHGTTQLMVKDENDTIQVALQYQKGLSYSDSNILNFNLQYPELSTYDPNLQPAALYQWSFQSPPADFPLDIDEHQGTLSLNQNAHLLAGKHSSITVLAKSIVDGQSYSTLVYLQDEEAAIDEDYAPYYEDDNSDAIILEQDNPSQSFSAQQLPDQASFLKADGLPYFFEITDQGVIQQLYPIPQEFKECVFKVYFETPQTYITTEVLVRSAQYDILQSIYQSAPPYPGQPGSTELGVSAHQAVIQAIAKATPGVASFEGASNVHLNNPYVDLFFPNLLSNALSQYVETLMSPTQLKNINVAALSKLIHDRTVVRGQLSINKIWKAIGTGNKALMKAWVPLYAEVFKQLYFAEEIARLKNPTTALPELVNQYKAKLATALLEEDEMGGLPEEDRTYDLFHHWIKLEALGAKSLAPYINSLIKKGIEIPTDAQSPNWKQYMGWFPDALQQAVDPQRYNGQTVLYFQANDLYPMAFAGINQNLEIIGKNNISVWTVEDAYAQKFIRQMAKTYQLQGGSVNGFTFSSQVYAQSGVNFKFWSFNEISQHPDDAHINLSNADAPPIGLYKQAVSQQVGYKINDRQIVFSPNRPFINADYKKAGAPFWLCVEPESLKSNLPQFSNKGIGQLKVGSKLLSWGYHQQGILYQNGAFEVKTLEAVNPIGDDYLYDAVFPFYEIDHFPYSVGGRLNHSPDFDLIFTGAVVPALSKYPYAGIAILKALLIVGQQVSSMTEKQLNQLLSIGRSNVLSRTLDITQLLYDVVALKTADVPILRQIDSLSQSGVEEVISEDGTVEDLLEKYSLAFTDLLRSTSKDKGQVNPMLYRCLLSMVSNSVRSLATAIELGWRVFHADTSALSSLDVTVSGLKLDADTAFSNLKQKIEMDLALHSEKGVITSLINANPNKHKAITAFHYIMDTVAPFDLRGIRSNLGTERHKLIFNFSMAVDGQKQPTNFKVEGFLPLPMPAKYQTFEWPIQDEQGNYCGTLCFDTRQLSAPQRELEQKNQKVWTSGNRLGFALLLGERFGKALKQFAEKMIPELVS